MIIKHLAIITGQSTTILKRGIFLYFKILLLLEIILNRYEFPNYKRKLNVFNAYSKNFSDFCGDFIEVFLKIEEDRILDIGYDGKLCTISQGVVEIIIDRIINKSIYEVKKFSINDIEELVGQEILKIRTKCCLIGIETIKNAISEYERNYSFNSRS
ncbi:MAG: iron-sulfur cluster assembly scaffold protein [candidate division WOR-3 bacterium]